jgi:Flp pilus assembly protein TadG
VTATRRSATKRRRQAQGGNTLIEFALSGSILFLILAGVFQFGYAFYAYNVLVNSVRNAARYASNYPYSSTSTTPDSTYLANVQNMVVYRTPAPTSGSTPLLGGLSTSNVSVVMTGGNAGGLTPPAWVKVSIVNYTLDAAFTTLLLNGRPNCSFPYTGILTPP